MKSHYLQNRAGLRERMVDTRGELVITFADSILMPRLALLRSIGVGGHIASKLGVTSFNLGLLQHGSLENHLHWLFNFPSKNGNFL